jgi:predicted kinase
MDALGINLHDEGSRARVEELQWSLGQRLLALGHAVIIEWGTWARAERDALRIGARALGAAVELRYTSAAPDVLIQRIRARARETPPIAERAIHQWFNAFQVPNDEEFSLYDSPFDATPDLRGT